MPTHDDVRAAASRLLARARTVNAWDPVQVWSDDILTVAQAALELVGEQSLDEIRLAYKSHADMQGMLRAYDDATTDLAHIAQVLADDELDDANTVEAIRVIVGERGAP